MMYQMRTLFCLVTLLFLLPLFGVHAQATDSFTVTQMYGEDTELPTIPDPFSVTPIAPTQIDVDWGTSTDNVRVSAYLLYRDGLQIATTTATFYSDTGLTPSTTYAYYVRALDRFGNLSTSTATLATTTFAVPIPPDFPPQSTLVPPQVVSIDVNPGSENARISFLARQPLVFELRYGRTTAVGEGFTQSQVFQRRHTTYLTDLEPSTTYYYELYGTDRLGRKLLIDKGSFKTLDRFILTTVPNVGAFTAEAVERSVSLSWVNPTFPAFAYVKLVRSHYGYPSTPEGGIVVYEGIETSYFDSGALVAHDRQYYTIFTFDIDGRQSSGAIALATLPGVVVPDPGSDGFEPVEGREVGTSTTGSLGGTALRFSDFEIIQDDILIHPVDDLFTVIGVTPFMLRVPAERVGKDVRSITAIVRFPSPSERTTAYLLRMNEAGTHFEAYLDGMSQEAMYGLTLKTFSADMDALTVLRGRLSVALTPGSEPKKADDVVYVALTYVIVGGFIGLLTVLGLWWLLLGVVRAVQRRRLS